MTYVLANSYPIWMISQPDITWLILVASYDSSWVCKGNRLAKYNLSPDTTKTGKKTKNTPLNNFKMISDYKNTGSSL